MRYAILNIGRCGGHLLVDLLAQTGVAGFNGTRKCELYLGTGGGLSGLDLVEATEAHISQYHTTANGVGAVKINFPYLLALRHWSNWGAIDSLLQYFDRYIVLRREDKVAQAVSFLVAEGTGQWASYQKKKQDNARYDFDTIAWRVALIACAEEFYFAWLKQRWLEYMELTYEDLCTHQAYTLQTTLDYLGLDSAVDLQTIRPRLSRQHDQRKEMWVARYKAEREAME